MDIYSTGTLLRCQNCLEVLSYMNAPTKQESSVIICPDCGHDRFDRVDEEPNTPSR